MQILGHFLVPPGIILYHTVPIPSVFDSRDRDFVNTLYLMPGVWDKSS